MKPLESKNYGSIPHLSNSRLGPGDHKCDSGMERIATKKARDWKDLIIVQEKLDGSNCGILKKEGKIYALTRSGNLASKSRFEQHQEFAEWVRKREVMFDDMLDEQQRIVGEWLKDAHGTMYRVKKDPFYMFDVFNHKNDRAGFMEVVRLSGALGIDMPNTLHIGGPISVERSIKLLEKLPSNIEAIDPREGVVYRVQREGKVDFLVKYVKHTKVDGKYFKEGYRVLNKIL